MNTSALTFAIGDVHGCLSKLEELLGRCGAYAGRRPHRFVFLGDYIDRGHDSRGVIHRLRRMGRERPGDIVCLMGNHEEILLSAVDDPADVPWWMDNGGGTTLASYGVRRVEDLPADDIAWIRNLPLCYDDGLRFFVHAGINPDAPLDRQDRETVLWTRKHAPDAFDPGRFIVHGHTPLQSHIPELHPHRLNLDTGAVYGGQLSAAAFTTERAAPVALLVSGKVVSLGDAPA